MLGVAGLDLGNRIDAAYLMQASLPLQIQRIATADGAVGPIGGIRQKLAGARDAGATLFLMPADHCAEAAGHVPDGLTVAPVSTLTDAVEAIRAYTSGGTVPTCPVDAA